MGCMRVYIVLTWLLVLLVAVTVTANGNVPLYLRDKPRSIRGFKNQALSTARGFGKRSELTSAYPQLNDRDSFPADWFAHELQGNAELARLVVRKFIDSDQDGELSAEELLRPLFDRQNSMYK